MSSTHGLIKHASRNDFDYLIWCIYIIQKKHTNETDFIVTRQILANISCTVIDVSILYKRLIILIYFNSVSLDGTDVDVTVIRNLPSKQIVSDFFSLVIYMIIIYEIMIIIMQID